MNSLPVKLYRAAQVRELDRVAIEQFHLPGITLMERAGAVCFKQLRACWPHARRIGVLCGEGNNGGDGFVIARLAHELGFSVDVFCIGNPVKISGDALLALRRLEASGVRVQNFVFEHALASEVWVDALLGSGLNGEVVGVWRAAIDALNASGVPVLAVDVPSGLNSDTGYPMGAAVHATLTVCLIGLKPGLLTGIGPEYAGKIVFDDLGVPPEVYAQVPSFATRISATQVQEKLPPRARGAHKGQFGHVLVVGGEQGMSGAVRLAAEAAARVGAGWVSVATRAAHASVLNIARPELMCHAVEHVNDLRPLLARADVVAVGPGLGQHDWGRALFTHILDTDLPLILDADALNLLASSPRACDRWVLTPHPGEAARLLGISSAEVQRDRFAAAQTLQERYAGVVVLKGLGTLIATVGEPIVVCSSGNPGMASGGMGDVLTGVIAGLVAQGLSLRDAAIIGVQVHALAADLAAGEGERGLLASDVLAHLRRVVNPS